MSTSTHTPAAIRPRSSGAQVTTGQVTTGWVITGLVGLFLAFDAVTHLARTAPVMEFNDEIGAPGWFPVVCGAVLATCLVTYLVPRTRAMGTILITAYLGGACAINLVTAAPAFNVVFAVGTAVLVWAGAWPRDERLRALVRN